MRPLEKAKKCKVLPTEGTLVKTKVKLFYTPEGAKGFLVQGKHIDARVPNTIGTYIGWVPGAGGDVWWIKHEDGSVGAYEYTELTDVRKAKKPAKKKLNAKKSLKAKLKS